MLYYNRKVYAIRISTARTVLKVREVYALCSQ